MPDGWPGTVILVTNPVDPLGLWAQRRTGLARTRLLGYTLNDSLRLRTGIGRVLGVAPGRVEAWTLGEHEDLNVACMIGLGVGQVIAGPISDARGRRRPLLAGILGYTASSVVCRSRVIGGRPGRYMSSDSGPKPESAASSTICPRVGRPGCRPSIKPGRFR